MTKKIIPIGFFLLGVSVSAQEVISTQGNSYSSGGFTIDFTIGEPVTETVSNGTNDLTQGFHQTKWSFLGVEDFAPNFEAVIFPNPTADVLNIRAGEFQNVTYTLYDQQGKMVITNVLLTEQTPIQVSQLAPGSYYLTLNNEKQILKTFNLIKTQ
jgi:hypothetical protein